MATAPRTLLDLEVELRRRDPEEAELDALHAGAGVGLVAPHGALVEAPLGVPSGQSVFGASGQSVSPRGQIV